MEASSSIFVAGHRGLVGSALVRKLRSLGYGNLILRGREELDLVNQEAVEHFFRAHKIDFVFVAAAKVGGILYNQRYQADFLYENLMIACNVIRAASRHGVRKLIFLGSSCIYPKEAPQPLRGEHLLCGPLEPTNEGYALAKIAGLKLCEKYREQEGKRFVAVMPTNLYGPGDNFHPEHSHVIPGLMRRFHNAKQVDDECVSIWGSGEPLREFLHVDDLAEALVLVMRSYEKPEILNIGSGEELKIRDVANLIKDVVGFSGRLEFDRTKPDGMRRKLLDTTAVRSLGWKPRISLRDGLGETYQWALANDVFGDGVGRPALAAEFAALSVSPS